MTAEIRATIVKAKDVTPFRRGNGVETALLIGRERGAARFTSGLTSFPPDSGAPFHCHNCDEQVTVLSGSARVEVGGQTDTLGPHDSTFIPAGLYHRFVNTGREPLVILWIYDADHVTRTFQETGVTVTHLSGGDTVV